MWAWAKHTHIFTFATSETSLLMRVTWSTRPNNIFLSNSQREPTPESSMNARVSIYDFFQHSSNETQSSARLWAAVADRLLIIMRKMSLSMTKTVCTHDDSIKLCLEINQEWWTTYKMHRTSSVVYKLSIKHVYYSFKECRMMKLFAHQASRICCVWPHIKMNSLNWKVDNWWCSIVFLVKQLEIS